MLTKVDWVDRQGTSSDSEAGKSVCFVPCVQSRQLAMLERLRYEEFGGEDEEVRVKYMCRHVIQLCNDRPRQDDTDTRGGIQEVKGGKGRGEKRGEAE